VPPILSFPTFRAGRLGRLTIAIAGVIRPICVAVCDTVVEFMRADRTITPRRYRWQIRRLMAELDGCWHDHLDRTVHEQLLEQEVDPPPRYQILPEFW
jgi:hypothetical protein